MRKLLFLVVATLFLLVSFKSILNYVREQPDAPTRKDSKSKHTFSTTEADSFWVIVNKERPLSPLSYAPEDLIKSTIPLRSNITDEESKVVYAVNESLMKLVTDAASKSINLELESGYRSYEFQKRLYESYADKQGAEEADSYSARAGYSEHQTGLAVDLGSVSNIECNVRLCFANTPEARWLSDNAHQYGFIIRYPQNKQSVTGYEYEPWHLRYVGIYLATKMSKQKDITLEEYFKFKPGT